MPDERVRLVQELDTTGARRGMREMEREYDATTGRMVGASRRVDQSVSQVGASMRTAGQVGARAMTAMSAGIGAATAAAAASERQWLALGTVILGSFAAGGPVAGGIALIASAIGVLTGSTKDLKAEARATADAFGAWEVAMGRAQVKSFAILEAFRSGAIPGARVAIESNIDSLFPALGLSGVAQTAKDAADRERLQELTEAAQKDALQLAASANQQARAFLAVKRAGDEYLETLRLLQTAQALDLFKGTPFEGDIANIIALLDQAREKALELEQIRRNEEIRRQRNSLELLQVQGSPQLVRELPILQQIAALKEQIERADRFEINHLHELLKIEEQRLAVVRAQAVMEQQRAQAEAIRKQWEQLIQPLGQTLAQGLAQIIADGIATGFRNGAQIAQQIVAQALNQIISQLVSMGVNSLISAVLGGLSGAVGGGGGFGAVVSAVAGGSGGGFASGGGLAETVGTAVGGASPCGPFG